MLFEVYKDTSIDPLNWREKKKKKREKKKDCGWVSFLINLTRPVDRKHNFFLGQPSEQVSQVSTDGFIIAVLGLSLCYSRFVKYIRYLYHYGIDS